MKQITNWSQATVFDCETNGLLKEAVLYHVLSFQMKGKENPSSIPGEVKDRLINFFKWHLDNKVPVVAHNAILYDIPVAEKLLGLDLSELMVIDTLPLSWYLNVNRKQHGLDSFHADYGIEKPKIEDWSNLSYEQYQHRCQEDVRINVALWEDFKERLVDMYTKAKDAIDSCLVGGKRVSDDEVIYLDRLKGLPVDQHIDTILTFLMGKMDTYRLQEKRGFLLDVEHLTLKDKEFNEKINSVKKELESVMPMVPDYTKRKKPKELFKQNGEYSVSGAKWIELVRKYKEKELDEHGNQIVIISDNEIKDSEGRVRAADFIEEFKEITKYKPANANSVDQIKSLLYSHGWVPESFDEVDDKPAIEKWIANGKRWKDKPPKRKVPQVTIKGEDGKELCPSVERLAEDVPQIKLYSNYNLVKHRSGVIKGFLKNMDHDTHHIEASIGGLTNTLRVCHRNVVNLVGVDKPYGEDIRGSFIAGEGNIALGSDLSSLEDRVKHHFMIPHDPEYVKTMMAPDFDPHILMALVAKFITQEEFDAFKLDKDHAPKHVKSARKSGKSTNYASQYNAGAPTISKTAGVSEAKGYMLHEAYWELNWSIKKIAEEQVVIETCRNIREPLKWLINPINGMLYNIRKEGDIFSTLCQGTGSFFFDMWIDNVLNAMYDLFKMKTISLQMHDELVLVFKDTDKFRKIFYKIVDDAIKKVNINYLLRRDLACDIQFGHRYSEIH